MAVHFLDTIVFGDSVGTADMRELFSETATIQRWLDVEVALARAQAAMGIIPGDAGEIIAAKADASLIDLEAVRASGSRTGHSLLGVLGEFRKLIHHDHARYVHFGATTQDIIDTGLMLAVRDGYAQVMDRLSGVMQVVAGLAGKHASTIMVGRTHGGHALPITFGFKAAIWLSELSRQLERWEAAQARILVGNMTGAVGTFASWGDRGFEVQERTLALLGLGVRKPPGTVPGPHRQAMTLCASWPAPARGSAARSTTCPRPRPGS